MYASDKVPATSRVKNSMGVFSTRSKSLRSLRIFSLSFLVSVSARANFLWASTCLSSNPELQAVMTRKIRSARECNSGRSGLVRSEVTYMKSASNTLNKIISVELGDPSCTGFVSAASSGPPGAVDGTRRAGLRPRGWPVIFLNGRWRTSSQERILNIVIPSECQWNFWEQRSRL